MAATKQTHPCCRETAAFLRRALEVLEFAEEARRPPATIEDADYLDVVKIVREAREGIVEHERLHRQCKRVFDAMDEKANAEARIAKLEARLSSYALDDALASFKPQDLEGPPLDDPARIPGAFITAVIYELFVETGEWPTPLETAERVAVDHWVSLDAAHVAIQREVQVSFHSVHTEALLKHGEAVSRSDTDYFRLMVRDQDVPGLAADLNFEAWYDGLIEGWRERLLQSPELGA